jgi:hypothetical protein
MYKKDFKFINHLDYYKDQYGGNLSFTVYRGSRYGQRGAGWFTDLAKKYAYPALKYLAKQAWIGGKDIYQDVSSGQKFSTALKRSAKKRAASALHSLGEKLEQSGSGLRKKPRLYKKRRIRRRRSKKVKTKRKRGRKRRRRVTKKRSIRRKKNFKDIFHS